MVDDRLREMGKKPSWNRDFFLSYKLTPEEVYGGGEDYQRLHAFYTSNKRDQRQSLISGGLSTPESFPGSSYIVRPLRHYGGIGYRVTRDAEDYDTETEYISPCFLKNCEYRVIFLGGIPLITMIKRKPPGIGREQAWNHQQGASFVTVNNEENNRLRHTSFLEDALKVPIIKSAHLCAVDILYRQQKYAVTEVNFCPAITVPANLERIRQHVSEL